MQPVTHSARANLAALRSTVNSGSAAPRPQGGPQTTSPSLTLVATANLAASLSTNVEAGPAKPLHTSEQDTGGSATRQRRRRPFRFPPDAASPSSSVSVAHLAAVPSTGDAIKPLSRSLLLKFRSSVLAFTSHDMGFIFTRHEHTYSHSLLSAAAAALGPAPVAPAAVTTSSASSSSPPRAPSDALDAPPALGACLS